MKSKTIVSISNGHLWIVRDNMTSCKRCHLPRDQENPDDPCKVTAEDHKGKPYFGFVMDNRDERFMEALEITNPDQHEALKLSVFASFEQIAAIQNVPIGTAKTRVFRAKQKIRIWRAIRDRAERMNEQRKSLQGKTFTPSG